MLAGAGLRTSNLKREYPSHVYRHCQYHGVIKEGSDDHQSPIQPSRFIELRIEPALSFYSKRVPKYTHHGFVMKVMILLLGVTSSVLARYALLAFVMVATSAATAVTSWAEFSEDARKVERYSSAVNNLEKLLSWWRSLGEVREVEIFIESNPMRQKITLLSTVVPSISACN